MICGLQMPEKLGEGVRYGRYGCREAAGVRVGEIGGGGTHIPCTGTGEGSRSSGFWDSLGLSGMIAAPVFFHVSPDSFVRFLVQVSPCVISYLIPAYK